MSGEPLPYLRRAHAPPPRRARHRPQPGELAPTNHRLGGHGDLYRCAACGTVSQPSLPGGDALRSLYRRMNDRAYLDEEAGRRRAAGRLLDMLEKRVGGRRLLDAGCGHGLLLDEARLRGWETVGLDLSAAAAAHARDRLGLDVRETPLEEFSDERGFDALVLADVIEHVRRPARRGASTASSCSPPAVWSCSPHPTPRSRVARLTGDRWWGFLPRARLPAAAPHARKACSCDRGFELVACAPAACARSPCAYWFSGASERGGPLAASRRWSAGSCRTRLPLSLTLRDEYVLVARRPALAARALRQPPRAPAPPAARGRDRRRRGSAASR